MCRCFVVDDPRSFLTVNPEQYAWQTTTLLGFHKCPWKLRIFSLVKVLEDIWIGFGSEKFCTLAKRPSKSLKMLLHWLDSARLERSRSDVEFDLWLCLCPCKLTTSSHLFARWQLFRHVGYIRHQQQVDLWHFDLENPMYATDRQTDVRR